MSLENSFLGPCPFPESDLFRAAWNLVARQAEKEDAEAMAAIEGRDPSDPATFLDICAKKFDVQVKAVLLLLGLSGYTDETVECFKIWLERARPAMQSWAVKHMGASMRAAGMPVELKLRLAQRAAYWKAIALNLSPTSGSVPAVPAAGLSTAPVSAVSVPFEQAKHAPDDADARVGDFPKDVETLETLPSTSVSPNLTTSTERRTAVDTLLLRSNEQPDLPEKVIRKHIWQAVGHRQSRQFEYWQAASKKATGEDDKNFRRILAMSPADFVDLLVRMKLLRSRD